MDDHFVQPSYVPGIGMVDPFAVRTGSFRSLCNALLATAIFRCWHILLFYGAWSTGVCVISHNISSLAIQPTLLTVLGTVLGFVISYRTTSSFERYNEGRRLWSQIILGSRTFARTVWFHVPDVAGEGDFSQDEKKARVMVEKVTVINLLQAFGTAIKHYLRGEDGIHYEDLYHLVKFLPSYAFPAAIPSLANLNVSTDPDVTLRSTPVGRPSAVFSEKSVNLTPALAMRLSSVSGPRPAPLHPTAPRKLSAASRLPPPPASPRSTRFSTTLSAAERGEVDIDEDALLPARNPPRWGLFDVFPLSLFINARHRRGKPTRGRKAARARAKLRGENPSHNIPLEISLYLSSYVAALQQRKVLDPPTSTALMNTLTQLVDALTGLERILTTPIPFSYSVHLWVVCSIYCLVLPFQIWNSLEWLTIPGTVIVSFIFFGFLVAGEEIENPFGYDKNDLNMDHFTHNILRNELRAITSAPAPDVSAWAFSRANDACLASLGGTPGARATPQEWIRRGSVAMREQLAS